MSACIRPVRIFASYTSNAITAGISAQMNASGENHASAFSPTSASVKMSSRTR